MKYILEDPLSMYAAIDFRELEKQMINEHFDIVTSFISHTKFAIELLLLMEGIFSMMLVANIFWGFLVFLMFFYVVCGPIDMYNKLESMSNSDEHANQLLSMHYSPHCSNSK